VFCPPPTTPKSALYQFVGGSCIEVDLAICAIDPSAPNYWHFVAYQLPIIIINKDWIISSGSRILISNYVNYAREYIELLGIHENCIIDLRNRCVFSKSLQSPIKMPSRDPAFECNDALHCVAESFGFLKSMGTPSRRVFIERKSSNNGSNLRGVYPLDAWHQFLASNGFEIVYLEGVSVADQASLFSQCRVLIALHGAALTNIIYMARGMQVIELMHHKGMENGGHLDMFMSIALKKKLRFSRIECESFLCESEELKIQAATGNFSSNPLPVKHCVNLEARILSLLD